MGMKVQNKDFSFNVSKALNPTPTPTSLHIKIYPS